MSELYSSFFIYYTPKNGRDHYAVRWYITNSKRKVKIFSVKKYGSRNQAYDAACAYFKELYGFLPDS